MFACESWYITRFILWTCNVKKFRQSFASFHGKFMNFSYSLFKPCALICTRCANSIEMIFSNESFFYSCCFHSLILVVVVIVRVIFFLLFFFFYFVCLQVSFISYLLNMYDSSIDCTDSRIYDIFILHSIFEPFLSDAELSLHFQQICSSLL